MMNRANQVPNRANDPGMIEAGLAQAADYKASGTAKVAKVLGFASLGNNSMCGIFIQQV